MRGIILILINLGQKKTLKDLFVLSVKYASSCFQPVT